MERLSQKDEKEEYQYREREFQPSSSRMIRSNGRHFVVPCLCLFARISLSRSSFYRSVGIAGGECLVISGFVTAGLCDDVGS